MTDEAKSKRKAERDQLSVARRLMASAEKREAIAEWLDRREAMKAARGGELVLPDHTADVKLIQARLRARAMVILEDILLHSTVEKNQLRAAELSLQMPEETRAALPASVRAEVIGSGEEDVPRVELPEDKIDQVHNALVLQRQLMNRGAA